MKPCLGRRPRTGDAKLRVKFRNGQWSRWEYTAAQLTFRDRGNWDFDVVGYVVVGGQNG